MISWINGQAANSVSVQNRGFAYADGLFETIAVQQQKALLWEPHLARLQRGLTVLGIHCDIAMLQQEVNALLAHAQGDCVLKLSVVRCSDGQRGFKPTADAGAQRLLQLMPWQANQQPIRMQHCETPLVCNPLLNGLKTLNALQYVLAAAELKEGFDEGVICDLEGHIVECTKSNVFWVNATGVLVTPDLSKAGINGIIRQEILQRAKLDGIAVKVSSPSLDSLQGAREIFVTNSLVGVQSVHNYEGRELTRFDMAETIRELLRGDIFEIN